MFQKISIVFLFNRLLFSDAHANIGLPITLIEGWVMKKEMPEHSWKKLMKASFLANFMSTLLGIPVTWFVMAMIQLFIVSHRIESFVIINYVAR